MLALPKVQLPVTAQIVDGTVQTLPPRIVRDFLEQILQDPQEPPIDWYHDNFDFLERFRLKLDQKLADRVKKTEGDRKTEGDKKTEGDTMIEGDFKTEGDKFLDGIPMTETIENGVCRRTDPFTLLWEKESLDFSLLEDFEWGQEVKHGPAFEPVYNFMKHNTSALKYQEMFCNVEVPFFGPIF